MAAVRLFHVEDVHGPPKGCVALVPFGLHCPAGHGPLVAFSEWQPALFFFGGYGATRRTTWHQCPEPRCRFSVKSEVSEINPRRPA